MASRCAAKGSEGIGGGAGDCADAVPVTCANHVAESQARHTVLKGCVCLRLLSKILTDFRFSFLFLFNKIPVKYIFFYIRIKYGHAQKCKNYNDMIVILHFSYFFNEHLVIQCICMIYNLGNYSKR